MVEARPIDNTRSLMEAVASAVPGRDLVKTLSRVFQAIRIAVNDEITMLERALASSVTLLNIGGRIAVISYHSLEDRPVKHFLRYGNLRGDPIRDAYGNLITPFKPVTRKAVKPDEDECRRNPRARSARLRISERCTEERYTDGGGDAGAEAPRSSPSRIDRKDSPGTTLRFRHAGLGGSFQISSASKTSR